MAVGRLRSLAQTPTPFGTALSAPPRRSAPLRPVNRAASPKEKARQEEELGLSGKEVALMTGKDYLRTKRFRRKADEIAGGEFRKVAVEKESARVYLFDAADSEIERAEFVREGGEWKAWLPVPKPLKLE